LIPAFAYSDSILSDTIGTSVKNFALRPCFFFNSSIHVLNSCVKELTCSFVKFLGTKGLSLLIKDSNNACTSIP
jgi:hypothetical protein